LGRITLRLPISLREQVRELARRENVSINQMTTLALAEKISALLTEEYLGERAARGDAEAFGRALDKVADVAPEEGDGP